MYLNLNISTPLDYDPYECSVVLIKGKLTDGCEEEDTKVEVGEISLYAVDTESIVNSGERNFYDIMDSIDHQLMEIADEFYKGNSYLIPSIEKEVFGISLQDEPANMLHISHLHVKKDFRKRNLGKAMVDRVMRLLGKNHVILTIKPFPLQRMLNSNDDPVYKDDYSDLPSGDRSALTKLRTYYKKWGFKKLRNSEYFYMPTDQWFIENPVPIDIDN